MPVTIQGRILSLNCKGLAVKSRQHFKDKFRSFDLILLQETHCTNVNCRTLSQPGTLGMDHCFFPTYLKPARGASIAFNHTVGTLIERSKWSDSAGRIAAVSIEKGERRLGVISVYAPNVNATRSSQETYPSFITDLEAALLHVAAFSKSIIGGR